MLSIIHAFSMAVAISGGILLTSLVYEIVGFKNGWKMGRNLAKEIYEEDEEESE